MLANTGVTVVSASGNNQNRAVELNIQSLWQPLSEDVQAQGWVGYEGYSAGITFTGNDQVTQCIVSKPVTVFAHWNEPLDAPMGMYTDIDVFMVDVTDVHRYFVGRDYNDMTRKPYERLFVPQGVYKLQFAMRGKPGTFTRHNTGPTKLFLIADDPTAIFCPFNGASDRSIWGHATSMSVVSVAAYNYFDLTKPAPYSAVGPAPMDYDWRGRPLQPSEVRLVPMIAGVDATPIGPSMYYQVLGAGSNDVDEDGTANFYGTSAAAAHVGAIAALALQASGGWADSAFAPRELKTVLTSSSQSAFYDKRAGHGLIDADIVITRADERRASRMAKRVSAFIDSLVPPSVGAVGAVGPSPARLEEEIQSQEFIPDLGVTVANKPASASSHETKNHDVSFIRKTEGGASLPANAIFQDLSKPTAQSPTGQQWFGTPAFIMATVGILGFFILRKSRQIGNADNRVELQMYVTAGTSVPAMSTIIV